PSGSSRFVVIGRAPDGEPLPADNAVRFVSGLPSVAPRVACALKPRIETRDLFEVPEKLGECERHRPDVHSIAQLLVGRAVGLTLRHDLRDTIGEALKSSRLERCDPATLLTQNRGL